MRYFFCVFIPLSLSHCHPPTITLSLSPSHYHSLIVTLSLSHSHCHPPTITLSLSPSHYHTLIVTLPPITVTGFYAECPSKRMYVSGSIYTKSKFLGLSLGVHLIGTITLTLMDHGEDYICTLPNAYAR